MPAPQFHLTFGELVARHPDIRPAMRAAVESEPVYTHLGSIFHDLPYYGNMIAEAIRYGFRRPAIDAPWAYRMHCIRPDRFVASFTNSSAKLAYMVRAVAPGTYAHPGATVEDMYRPEIQARTMTGTVVVTAP